MNKLMFLAVVVTASCSPKIRPKVLDVQEGRPVEFRVVPEADPIIRAPKGSTIYVVQGTELRALIDARLGSVSIPLSQITKTSKAQTDTIKIGITMKSLELLTTDSCLKCMPCCPWVFRSDLLVDPPRTLERPTESPPVRHQ